MSSYPFLLSGPLVLFMQTRLILFVSRSLITLPIHTELGIDRSDGVTAVSVLLQVQCFLFKSPAEMWSAVQSQLGLGPALILSFKTLPLPQVSLDHTMGNAFCKLVKIKLEPGRIARESPLPFNFHLTQPLEGDRPAAYTHAWL